MTGRPLIAVVAYHLGDDRVARWPNGGYGVPAPYIEALWRAGGRAAIVSPGEPGEPAEILGYFDALVLVGGGDVDPSAYGAAPDLEHNYGVEIDRDAFEIGLVRAARSLGVPTLCICRGMQVMNVAFGGTLHQHLPELPGLIEHGVPLDDTVTMHRVSPATGTLLAASTTSGDLECSSHHHQGIDILADDLVASGLSPDGLIEAIEPAREDATGGWLLGVQWHPEETASHDPSQQRLFDTVVERARARRAE